MWRRAINLGTSKTTDLAEQSNIRLINIIAVIGLVCAIISESYVLVFLDFYFWGVIMVLISCICFAAILYLNHLGYFKYPKWILITYMQFSLVYTMFLLKPSLNVANIFFSFFVLHVALFKNKKIIILLSAICLSVILSSIFLHHYNIIQPILHFSEAQSLLLQMEFTAVGAVLTLLVSFFMKFNLDRFQLQIQESNEKLKEAFLQINNQKTAIEESLSEKEVLLKEIHHRIKNNFQIIISLLDLQMDGMKESRSKESLGEAKSRIKSMALIHQKLYQSDSLKRIKMKGYFEEIIEDNVAYFFQIGSKEMFVLDFEEFELNMEQAVPMGLIFNELITNFFKHVVNKHHAPKMLISILIENKRLIFVAKDNGIGLSEEILKNGSENTLGLLLTKMLVRQISGKKEKYNDEGLTTRIEFEIED